jgi:hypothetical protein
MDYTNMINSAKQAFHVQDMPDALFLLTIVTVLLIIFNNKSIFRCLNNIKNIVLRENFMGLDTNAKLDRNICSKSCCKQSYPVPFMNQYDPRVPNPDDYIRTNLMCNYGEGSGCLCTTKKQKDYISSRAGNVGTCNGCYPNV